MTDFLKKSELENKWYHIDATNVVVGRLAAEITKILRGKNKATYTPNENYFGSDSFTFEAVDTTAKKILNTATASITINPVNDAPVVEDMQELEGIEDTELTITLSGTDIDGDNLSFEVDTAPTQGSITENGTTFTYTPNQDFYGADSLCQWA